jgi:hypothetical protein
MVGGISVGDAMGMHGLGSLVSGILVLGGLSGHNASLPAGFSVHGDVSAHMHQLVDGGLGPHARLDPAQHLDVHLHLHGLDLHARHALGWLDAGVGDLGVLFDGMGGG